MKSTLFVGIHNPHYANLALADSIKADIYRIPVKVTKYSNMFQKTHAAVVNSLSIPSGYKTYLTEANFFYPALKRKLGLLSKNSKIINLYATPLLYFLHKNERLGKMERFFAEKLMPEIDGNIVLGNFGLELIKKFNELKNKPTIKTSLWMSNAVVNTVNSIPLKPNLNTNNIFTVALFDWYYKGLDILLKGFENAWKENNKLKLFIFTGGNAPPQELFSNINKDSRKNIHILNKLPLNKYFETIRRCSLYVHMGRGEAFGLAIIEAMYSGIPAIVSKYTGAKDAAGKLGKKFIIPLETGVLGKRILDYMALSKTEKSNFSKNAKKIASFYTEKNLKPKFIKAFNALVEKI